jgi:cytochrome c oxidase subunit 2
MESSFWLPEQGSTLAPHVDRAFYVALAFSGLVLLVVVTSIGLAVLRSRRAGPSAKETAPDPEGASGIGGRALAAVTALVVGAALLGLYGLGLVGFVDAAVAPGDALEIGVTAENGKWAFSYPDDANSDNELRVPLGRPVRLSMTSKDLVHTFFVPELRVQRAIVPGTASAVWFQATQAGDLAIACADDSCNGESNHAKVVVMEEPAFKAWLDSAGGGTNLPPAERGRKLYTKKTCIVCHSLDGTRIQGPTFKNVWGRTEELEGGGKIVVDSAYVHESILEPQAKIVKGYPPVMPSFKGLLTDEDIASIEAFLKTVH